MAGLLPLRLRRALVVEQVSDVLGVLWADSAEVDSAQVPPADLAVVMFNMEIEGPDSRRGASHEARIRANDPQGEFTLELVP
jgi:hypothetical protein